MKKSIIAATIIAAFSGITYAEESIDFTPNLSPESLSMAASGGILNGKSHEMVYYDGRKLSELDWKIKNVAILKGDVSWDAYPNLTLNARGWTSLSSGSGNMDDYDWVSSSQSGWTDHSSHPDTDVNYANEYDLNFKAWAYVDENYRAGIVVGYQENRFSWTAKGGDFNYSNGTNVGSFPAGERACGYSQRFSMPYIGLVGRYRIDDFEFNAMFKYSDWARAHDNDEHYMRTLTVRDKANDLRYYGASLDAGYFITPNAKVFTELTYSKYGEGKGGTERTDYSTGTSFYRDGNATGISNRNYTLTAGLQYQF